jgi:hypothetical protein
MGCFYHREFFKDRQADNRELPRPGKKEEEGGKISGKFLKKTPAARKIVVYYI